MGMYIVEKDNIILKVYNTKEGEEGVKKALANVGISNYNSIIEIGYYDEMSLIDTEGYYIGLAKPTEGYTMVIAEPEIKEGFIPKWTDHSWVYEVDIIGTWYDKYTTEKREVFYREPNFNSDLYTRMQPPIAKYSKWDADKWVFDSARYTKLKCDELRYKCRSEREQFFPDSVKDNLLIGQVYDNPLLTIENYNKLVTIYRDLVSVHEPEILKLTTKDEIDSYYDSIHFISYEELLNKIKGNNNEEISD